MFTVIAFLLVGVIGWYADRMNVKDRSNIAILSDDEVRSAILHTRQDVKFVAFLLGAIIVMLGIIADRIH